MTQEMGEYYVAVGNLLRKYREDLAWSQLDVASMTDISLARYQLVEKGAREFSAYERLRLIALYNWQFGKDLVAIEKKYSRIR